MRPAWARAALLLLCGCAAAPPAWLAEPAVWRIRQVVLIELGGTQFPVQGLPELDTAAGTVRLAALGDFGVTLFRLASPRRAQERFFSNLPPTARSRRHASARAAPGNCGMMITGTRTVRTSRARSAARSGKASV